MILCAVVLFYTAVNNLAAVWQAAKWVIGVFMPVIIGFAVFFILSPFAGFFERQFLRGGRLVRLRGMKPKAARLFSVIVSLFIVAAALTLIIVIIIPEIRTGYASLSETLPDQIKSAIIWIDSTAKKMGADLEFERFGDIDWAKVTDSVKKMLPTGEGSFVDGIMGTLSSVLGTLFDLVIGVVIGVKVVIEKEAVGRFFKNAARAFLKEERAQKLFEFTGLCREAFRNFMTGQLLEACSLGVMCCIGMVLFRFPYAAAVSAVMGVTALIPVFGAWIGAAFGTLMALTESPMRALLFLVFIVTLQAFDNTFIYPRIVGNSMKLHGLLVLTAVTVGGAMFGVAGMLLSVPAASVLYTLVNRAVDRRTGKKSFPNSNSKNA